MIRPIQLACQVLLILLGLSFVGFRLLDRSVNAQVGCGGQPPIHHGTFPMGPDALRANSWLQGTQVDFTIFDTSDDQAAQMEEGVRAWNGKTDCGNVYFRPATRGTNPSGEPGNDQLWITRGANTQVFPITNAANQMIASNIRVQTPYRSHTPNILVTLLSHEAGHSFGFLNAPASADTIMNGPMPFQTITACDIEAMRRVYCPSPTPTPTPTPTPPDDECGRLTAPSTSISRVGENRIADLLVGSKDITGLNEVPTAAIIQRLPNVR